MTLFSFLFPRWNFFDQPGNSFSCIVKPQNNSISSSIQLWSDSSLTKKDSRNRIMMLDWLLVHSLITSLADELNNSSLTKTKEITGSNLNIEKNKNFLLLKNRIELEIKCLDTNATDWNVDLFDNKNQKSFLKFQLEITAK